LTFDTISAIKLECDFVPNVTVCNDVYSCRATKLDVPQRHRNVTEVVGKNLEKKITSDVVCLQVASKTAKNIVNGLKKFFPNLNTLFWENSGVESIDRNNFKELRDLYFLSLANNIIFGIPKNTFNDLTRLKFLWLSGNQLKKMDIDVFAELKNLEEIYLHKNFIEEIRKGLYRNNPNLRTIYLSDNQLLVIDQFAFTDLKSLKALVMLRNRCTNLAIFAGIKLGDFKEIKEKCSNIKKLSYPSHPIKPLEGKSSKIKLNFSFLALVLVAKLM
jgi:Leucine-rich repeat (LRR) protein